MQLNTCMPPAVCVCGVPPRMWRMRGAGALWVCPPPLCVCRQCTIKSALARLCVWPCAHVRCCGRAHRVCDRTNNNTCARTHTRVAPTPGVSVCGCIHRCGPTPTPHACQPPPIRSPQPRAAFPCAMTSCGSSVPQHRVAMCVCCIPAVSWEVLSTVECR